MSRLIDADALKEELIKAREENEKEHIVLIDNDFMTLIHDAPTVDAYEEGYKMGKFHAREEIERCVRDLLAIYGGNK